MTRSKISLLADARANLHARMMEERLLTLSPDGVPSMADKDSEMSQKIAERMCELIGDIPTAARLKAQRAGSAFEKVIAEFVRNTFLELKHLRPGVWDIANTGKKAVSNYRQYEHLGKIAKLAKEHPELRTHLGQDYLVRHDILIGRNLPNESQINRDGKIVGTEMNEGAQADLREARRTKPLLHASVSCKWTIRSDRAQNARAEALNLLQLRRGASPHIVVVTGEPLPARIGAIALGSGAIDCVYHFALSELLQAAREKGTAAVKGALEDLVNGRRLKDISSLPLDLAI